MAQGNGGVRARLLTGLAKIARGVHRDGSLCFIELGELGIVAQVALPDLMPAIAQVGDENAATGVAGVDEVRATDRVIAAAGATSDRGPHGDRRRQGYRKEDPPPPHYARF